MHFYLTWKAKQVQDLTLKAAVVKILCYFSLGENYSRFLLKKYYPIKYNRKLNKKEKLYKFTH